MARDWIVTLLGAAAVALIIASMVSYRAESNCRARGMVWVTSPRDGQHACLNIAALMPAR